MTRTRAAPLPRHSFPVAGMDLFVHVVREGKRGEEDVYEFRADNMDKWAAPVVVGDLHCSVLREPDGEKKIVLRLANLGVKDKEGKPTSFERAWGQVTTKCTCGARGQVHVRVNPLNFSPVARDHGKKRKREDASSSSSSKKKKKKHHHHHSSGDEKKGEEPAKVRKPRGPMTEEQKKKRNETRERNARLKKEQEEAVAKQAPVPLGLPHVSDGDFDDEDS